MKNRFGDYDRGGRNVPYGHSSLLSAPSSSLQTRHRTLSNLQSHHRAHSVSQITRTTSAGRLSTMSPPQFTVRGSHRAIQQPRPRGQSRQSSLGTLAADFNSVGLNNASLVQDGPFEFLDDAIHRARNVTFKIGDVVHHEYIRQARLNPKWHWTDRAAGKWVYDEKDVDFDLTKHLNNPQAPHGQSNPAVHFGGRWGVVVEIYEGDAHYGSVALIVPMFSYGSSGLVDKHTDIAKREEFCAQHLAITHAMKSAEDPAYNPHPHAPPEAVLRLTSDSHHKPRDNSFLRISAPSVVHIHDPRIVKSGSLDKQSTELLCAVMLKTREMASHNLTERGNVDVSMFPWLQAMDRFSANRVDRHQAQTHPRQDTVRTVPPSLAPYDGSRESKLSPVPESIFSIPSTTKRKSSAIDSNDAVPSFDSGNNGSMAPPHTPIISLTEQVEILTNFMTVQDLQQILSFVQNRLQTAEETKPAVQAVAAIPTVVITSTEIKTSTSGTMPPSSGLSPRLNLRSPTTCPSELVSKRMQATRDHNWVGWCKQHDRPPKRAKNR
jgi:hypothetical protein